MIKPEWGTKRACPKCGTRFYDLGNDEPVTCIACATAWTPDAILKSKQPLPYDAPKPEAVAAVEPDGELVDPDLDLEEAAEGVEDDAADELGGDDEIAEVSDAAGEEER